MDKVELENELKSRIVIAHYIASNAGSLIKDLYHRKLKTTEKALHDFVTELDSQIEEMAKKSVFEHNIDDGFYGEESLAIKSKNGFEWVVDPIDGTNNFVRGLPLCGFQLAILYNDVPVFGLISRPLLQEVYTAIKGGGAHYTNDLTGESSKLRVSNKKLKDSIGMLDAKVGKSDNPTTRIMRTLADHIDMFRVFGVAVFDLPAVAEGSVEFLISGIAQKYDIAAGSLLIEEAGGVSYNIHGETIDLNDNLVIFSNPTIKNELVQLLKNA